MQAARNGFLYVIDRTNGELLRRTNMRKRPGRSRVDMATGRPVWSEQTKKILDHVEKIQNWPTSGGLRLVSSVLQPFDRAHVRQQREHRRRIRATAAGRVGKLILAAGGRSGGNTIKTTTSSPIPSRAVFESHQSDDGRRQVADRLQEPNWAGTLVPPRARVHRHAHRRAHRGSAIPARFCGMFQTSSGIVGQPSTWQQNGTQYVTVTSGDRNNDNARRQDPNIANVPMGGSLWTFKLLRSSSWSLVQNDGSLKCCARTVRWTGREAPFAEALSISELPIGEASPQADI